LFTRAWHILRLQVGDGLQIWRVAANILNKQSRTANKGGPTHWGLGVGLETLLHKKISLLQNVTKALRPGWVT
jgi:hypothetical protein